MKIHKILFLMLVFVVKQAYTAEEMSQAAVVAAAQQEEAQVSGPLVTIVLADDLVVEYQTHQLQKIPFIKSAIEFNSSGIRIKDKNINMRIYLDEILFEVQKDRIFGVLIDLANALDRETQQEALKRCVALADGVALLYMADFLALDPALIAMIQQKVEQIIIKLTDEQLKDPSTLEVVAFMRSKDITAFHDLTLRIILDLPNVKEVVYGPAGSNRVAVISRDNSSCRFYDATTMQRIKVAPLKNVSRVVYGPAGTDRVAVISSIDKNCGFYDATTLQLIKVVEAAPLQAIRDVVFVPTEGSQVVVEFQDYNCLFYDATTMQLVGKSSFMQSVKVLPFIQPIEEEALLKDLWKAIYGPTRKPEPLLLRPLSIRLVDIDSSDFGPLESNEDKVVPNAFRFYNTLNKIAVDRFQMGMKVIYGPAGSNQVALLFNFDDTCQFFKVVSLTELLEIQIQRVLFAAEEAAAVTTPVGGVRQPSARGGETLRQPPSSGDGVGAAGTS